MFPSNDVYIVNRNLNVMSEPINFVVNACQVRVLVRYMTIYQTRETQTRRELSWDKGILGTDGPTDGLREL
jgi:hypothetical protein